MNIETTSQATLDTGVPVEARDFSVKDRVVLVTGSGQGIGRELARQFAAAGSVAVIADINIGNAKAVATEIEAEGCRSMPIAVDVSDEASVGAMVEAVLGALGRIDVLVNNASIFSTLSKRPFEEITLAEWRKVMDVNITGVFFAPAR